MGGPASSSTLQPCSSALEPGARGVFLFSVCCCLYRGGAAGELQEEDHTQASTNLQQKPELSPNRQRGAEGELQEEDHTHCLKCL
ncbi:hypothetical protein JZ751_010695 [Albula glossodonta]|uniref:Uncharacterized protein n=1 Tax=Albula glossodonta TaxID=121402 RepID=A0A8T2MZV5_9TELE|nr:hypothetical protein JZ751_010695 [Albula glossodonta]